MSLFNSINLVYVDFDLKILKKEGLVNEHTIVQPNMAQTKDLLVVHSQQYLKSLKVNKYKNEQLFAMQD